MNNRKWTSEGSCRLVTCLMLIMLGATLPTFGAIRISSLPPLLTASSEFQRTGANATAYSAGDCLAPSETATNLPAPLPLVSGVQGGYITKASFWTSTNNCTALMTLWIYKSTNVIQQADNAAFAIKYTNAPITIGSIPIQVQAGTDCSYGVNTDIRMPFTLASSGDTNLYYFLQVGNAWTPIGQGTNRVAITVDPR